MVIIEIADKGKGEEARKAGLPTYSDPPIFTPISDLVSAGSDFCDCTPIFEIPIIGRIFSV